MKLKLHSRVVYIYAIFIAMSPKFFYAYLIGATVALLLAAYRLMVIYNEVSVGAALLYFIPAILLYYMAYKVYHVKNDRELM